MPVKSDAQRRFMYATAAGKTDAPPAVGREFLAASHGLKGLPKRVRHKVGKPAKRRFGGGY
jgi:hypothetical protein